MDQDVMDRQRAMWAAGDYPAIAPTIESAAEDAVAALEIEAGHAVLDVATGSGNAAVAAARLGATVTGLDLVPKLLDAARERIAAEGLTVELMEGDAQALPFPDDSFDRVTSVFGAMFAPDQARAAAELLRVCRPGGAIAVTGWTPAGLNGQMFATTAKHMPPPPPGFQPPILWGVEDHVRGLFADAADVRCATHEVVLEYPSGDEAADYIEARLGPLVLARAALEPQGKWDALDADLRALYAQSNEATDGTYRGRAEYLLTVATV